MGSTDGSALYRGQAMGNGEGRASSNAASKAFHVAEAVGHSKWSSPRDDSLPMSFSKHQRPENILPRINKRTYKLHMFKIPLQKNHKSNSTFKFPIPIPPKDSTQLSTLSLNLIFISKTGDFCRMFGMFHVPISKC